MTVLAPRTFIFKKEIRRYTIMMEPWAPCALSHKLRYWVRLGESVPLKQFEDHAWGGSFGTSGLGQLRRPDPLLCMPGHTLYTQEPKYKAKCPKCKQSTFVPHETMPSGKLWLARPCVYMVIIKSKFVWLVHVFTSIPFLISTCMSLYIPLPHATYHISPVLGEFFGHNWSIP